jgi:hypothetical protein
VITSDDKETLDLACLLPNGIPATVISIRKLLADYGIAIKKANAFSVNDFDNKYSYQSIKKIVSVISLQFKHSLVLDSECLLLRSTSFQRVFDQYFSSPILFHSQIKHPFLDRINRASASVIKANDDFVLSRWIFEYQAWFFDRDMTDAFRHHVQAIHGQDLFDVLVQTPDVFETISYNWFIYLNRHQYPTYKFVSIEDAITDCLGGKADQYLASYTNPHGIVEHFIEGLTSDNFEGLRCFVEQYRLSMFRWEPSSDVHYWLVRKFMRQCPSLAIVACSEHAQRLASQSFFIKQCIKLLSGYLKSVMLHLLSHILFVQTTLRSRD